MRTTPTIANLDNLLDKLYEAKLVTRVTGRIVGRTVGQVTDDSRSLQANGLFVAIEGAAFDGHLFVSQAIEQGASAIVCGRPIEADTGDTPVILVSEPRTALGILAHTFWGEPSRQMRLVGVTGTNGKTTTTWLVQHLLNAAGRKAGLIGTIECRIGDQSLPASLTTPAAPALNELLGQMVEAGCTEVAMEVSSHALAQDRVAGLKFSVGVFTNLTRDHLDFHGTWTNYFEAKKRLFTGLDPASTAVVNADDPASAGICSSTAATCTTFGMHGNPTHRFEILENGVDGLKITIDGDTRRYRLVGDFNAYNLTAAYTVGVSLGLPGGEVLDALESASPVPGRLEQFNFASGVTVIVDYAHTPDALEKALKAAKDMVNANSTLWCIFGCGGDRDPGKRPEMGAIAEAIADRVIVTSDNPRTEAPEAILDDIRDGMERPDQADWIVDRRDAIRFAGRSAASGDIVLVAGKGHEPYQVIGNQRVHLDDREEVRRWFR